MPHVPAVAVLFAAGSTPVQKFLTIDLAEGRGEHGMGWSFAAPKIMLQAEVA
jgi:hypothetical protein